jgi:cobalamin synthase
MSGAWHLLVAALRFDLRGPTRAGGARRIVPLAGLLLGLAAAGVYWLAAQLWPANVAVMLAMLATVLIASPALYRQGPGTMAPELLLLLIKYDALMALTAAKLPFVVPEHVTVGLMMVAGQAVSRALVVSLMAADAELTVPELLLTLALGAAPAVLIGIPGLIGLAAALAVRLALGALVLPRLAGPAQRFHLTQQVTEVCFYLGALAAWKYV